MSEDTQAAPGDKTRTSIAVDILRIDGGERREARELIVSERMLVVSTPRETIARLQYLPGQEVQLAAGFLVTAGLVSAGAFDIEVAALDSRTIEARLGVEIDPAKLAAFRERLSLAASGALSECDAVENKREVDEHFKIEAAVVSGAMKRFRDRSELFKETGAVHSAMIAGARGEEIAFAEDIGRHNALDKAVGDCILRKTALADKLLLTSGRLSVEMVSKCVRAGLPVVISPGAPTDRAVEIARAADLTLVGFARDDRMNVYTAEWRLL